jgi:hypothetical protein
VDKKEKVKGSPSAGKSPIDEKPKKSLAITNEKVQNQKSDSNA